MSKVSRYRTKDVVYITKMGYNYVVEDYINRNEVVIKFIDTGTVITTNTSNLREGSVRDPQARNIFGIGFIGIGPYNSTEHKVIYATWWSMLDRCYNTNSNSFESYGGCSVSDSWQNFQNFGGFYENDNYKRIGWHLDKDLLVNNNKIYCPETCVFLPKELNVLLAKQKKPTKNRLPQGVCKVRSIYHANLMQAGISRYLGAFSTASEAYACYKREKEDYVRSQAIYWSGLIDDRAIARLSVWTLPDYEKTFD